MKCNLKKLEKGHFELSNSDLFAQIYVSDTKNEDKYNIVTLTRKKKNGIGCFFASYCSNRLNVFREL